MDKKSKIIGITNIFLDIPSTVQSVSFFILTFLTFSLFIISKSLIYYIFYLLCIFLPNLITLIFTDKKLTLKRLIFINLFCFTIFSALFFIFCYLNESFLFHLIIYINGLLILFRLVILNITLDLKKETLLINSIFYSLISLILFNFLIYIFYKPLFYSFLTKSLLTLISFTLLAYIFLYIINLPILQVYGIKSQDIIRGIIDHWYDKGFFLESILTKISKKSTIPIHIYSFKDKLDKIKAIIIVPYFHIGPFGLIGGGKIYTYILKKLKETFKCPIFIFHGTTTHDFNPVNSYKKEEILEKIVRIVNNNNYDSLKGNIYYLNYKEATFIGLDMSNNLLFSVSFSPKPTDDVDLGLGLSIMNKFEKYFRKATYIDPHNCFKKGDNELNPGDPRYYTLEELVDQFKIKNKQKISLGFSNINDLELKKLNYIGENGISSLVGKVGDKKFALILIDGNNITPGLREFLINLVKKEKNYDFIEIYTTDNHSINTVRGVINPVKYHPILEKKILESVDVAEKNLNENLYVAHDRFLVELDTFGAKREGEIISTIETTVGIFKNLALPFLIISLLFMLILILMI